MALHLHFGKAEFARRQKAVRAALARLGLDGLLIFKQESMYWLTGYDTFGYVFFQCLYIGADGDMFLLTRKPDMLQAQLDRNVVQVHKAADGTRVRKPLNMVEDVIKLASRIGQFDLVSEYGLSPAIVETLDTTYALAVAAGLEVRKLNRLRAMLRDCCLRH